VEDSEPAQETEEEPEKEEKLGRNARTKAKVSLMDPFPRRKAQYLPGENQATGSEDKGGIADLV
jgi:hypothetical protein